jgi:hypothetical protein
VEYRKIAAENSLQGDSFLLFSTTQQVKLTLQTWQIPLENQESGTCEYIASLRIVPPFVFEQSCCHIFIYSCKEFNTTLPVS